RFALAGPVTGTVLLLVCGARRGQALVAAHRFVTARYCRTVLAAAARNRFLARANDTIGPDPGHVLAGRYHSWPGRYALRLSGCQQLHPARWSARPRAQPRARRHRALPALGRSPFPVAVHARYSRANLGPGAAFHLLPRH